MREKLSTAQLEQLTRYCAMDGDHSMKRWTLRLLDEHAALTAELKRARIQMLNCDSECAELRAELRETRRELDEALGRWP